MGCGEAVGIRFRCKPSALARSMDTDMKNIIASASGIDDTPNTRNQRTVTLLSDRGFGASLLRPF